MSLLIKAGDMLKAVYDANGNSRIEKDAMGITLDKLLKGAGAGVDPTEIDVPGVGYGRLGIEAFQIIPGIGTSGFPERINDADTGAKDEQRAIGEYSEILLPAALHVTQFRHYGDINNNGDGVWQVEYMDIDGNWSDWVTGVNTRTTADWSAWDSSGGDVVAIAIKITCTAVDSSAFNSQIPEVEVKY